MKKLIYKPFLYEFTAVNLASTIGLGIANLAWFAIVKVPNPLLVDAFYASLRISSFSDVASGADVAIDKDYMQSEEKS